MFNKLNMLLMFGTLVIYHWHIYHILLASDGCEQSSSAIVIDSSDLDGEYK